MSTGFAVSLLCGVVLSAGCGSAAGGTGSAAGGAAATGATGSNSPSTLPARAVPYLPSSVKVVTQAGLAREARFPALASDLGSWGFVSGSDRYFQGESRRLQVVDSRTLRFSRPDGALAFVGFMRAHAAAILGSFPILKPYVSLGRSGFLAIAQQCQCHLANPALLAVLTHGGVVTWLEINGPGATRRQLVRLLAGAP
ncbi:MAG: hypothetical protein M3018_06335 [Actinomycetota bacterium]|nr:hypothetical protein [Actinomycetota bacterium]